MSVTTVKSGTQTRPILAPTAGNQVQVIQDQRRKEVKKVIQQTPWKPVARCNVPADVKSSVKNSSDSNVGNGRRIRSPGVVRPAKKKVVSSDGIGTNEAVAPRPLKRCDWITPNSGMIFNLCYRRSLVITVV